MGTNSSGYITRRKLFKASLAAGSVALISACGGQASPAASASVSGGAAGSAPTTSAASGGLLAAARNEGKVVVYTNMLAERITPVAKAFEAAYSGVKVEIFRDLSSTLESKFNAEISANKVLADVVDIVSLAAFMGWKRQGVVMRYDSPEYRYYEGLGLPKGWLESGYYTVSKTYTWRPAINTSAVSKSDVDRIKDWKDVISFARDKKLKVITGDVPNVDGAYQFYYVMRKSGLDVFSDLLALKPELTTANSTKINKCVSGEDPVVFEVIDEYMVPEADKGAPIVGIWPASGVPSQPQIAGIPQAAPHPNAAKLFFDWFIGQPGQQAAAQVLETSVRKDVTVGKGIRPRSELNLLSWKVDFTDIEDRRKQWVDDFKRLEQH